MAKLTFEVWEDANGVAMFQKGAKAWKESLTPPLRLLHTYEAETLFESYQTYYDLMGWGQWKSDGLQDRSFTEDDRRAE